MRIYKNVKLDKSIAIDWNKSWYLYGEVGRGKTHNAYAVVKETNNFLREQQVKDEECGKFFEYPFVVFINFADVCDKLRNMSLYVNDPFTQTRADAESNIIRKPKLIIDDLGAEKRSDYSDDFLMRLVEYRYSNDLQTGFTSNLSLGKLPYDARIVSRIVGMVKDNKYKILGKDRRI